MHKLRHRQMSLCRCHSQPNKTSSDSDNVQTKKRRRGSYTHRKATATWTGSNTPVTSAAASFPFVYPECLSFPVGRHYVTSGNRCCANEAQRRDIEWP